MFKSHTHLTAEETEVIDYICSRRKSFGMIRDYKVKPEESTAAQHKIIVMDLVVSGQDGSLERI